MRKLYGIGFLLLTSLPTLEQNPPPLYIYTSPDSSFQFVYPDNYELWSGARIPNTIQGERMGIPVCNSSTAMACVVYPSDRFENTSFEAAAFSANRIVTVSAESDCLGYTDQLAPPRAHLTTSPTTINGRAFSYVSDTAMVTGHSQSAHLYRTFRDDRCYELRIAISISGVLPASPTPQGQAFTNADAEHVRAPLRRILNSFRFLK